MLTKVEYNTSTASAVEIEQHLRECSADFIPPLEPRLDIAEYARKIKDKAEVIEAWVDGKLVGMLAMYVDDSCRSGFITNVSVTGGHTGLGIASELMRRTVDIARSHDCMAIALQVDLNNHRAIALYEKFNFQIEGESQNPLSMVLSL